jgi:DNA-binding LytR/AlgR family response regulator
MREQLRARLAEVWPELQIVAEARNGLEAVDLVAEHRPDMVFLDIRMPGLTGVDARPPNRPDGRRPTTTRLLPEIVFITAYDQYAVEAFEQGVADYVLKPAERDRLQLTAQRIRARLAQRDAPDGGRAAGSPGRRCSRCCTSWRRAQPRRRAAIPAVDPGQRGPGHPDDPGGRRAVLHQRREVHRVQTATTEALIRKPIKELVDELDPQRVLADPPQHAGQREGDRRRHAGLPRPPDRQRARPRREAGSQPQLHAPVQGHVNAPCPAPAVRGPALAQR